MQCNIESARAELHLRIAMWKQDSLTWDLGIFHRESDNWTEFWGEGRFPWGEFFFFKEEYFVLHTSFLNDPSSPEADN